MKKFIYQNELIGKKQLKHLLAWSFTHYNSVQACSLADELKFLGFKYSTQAGISISIEDLKVPFAKGHMLEQAIDDIHNTEKIYIQGKIANIEKFQKIINTWNLTSEALKKQILYYFKTYDPLNSVYIMAFSGARGNLSQVRQLVGIRGLMSDSSGQIMKLPIKNNFREGLTVTDYLMSSYGARKGIIDTALKTANSGYLTRRLIDVVQDILIREKDCLTTNSFLFNLELNKFKNKNYLKSYDLLLGRTISKAVFNPKTNILLAKKNDQITLKLIEKFKKNSITKLYIRSPFTCELYRSICQKCYGRDLATENIVEIGEAIGILAGQSIGEPGTQLTMRTFHTGGIFTSDILRQKITSPLTGIIQFSKNLKIIKLRTNCGDNVLVTKNFGSLILIPQSLKEKPVQVEVPRNTIIFPKNNQFIEKNSVIGEIINVNKQIKSEVQTILSETSGEIFIPKVKQNKNISHNNRVIWLLKGQFYQSPRHSFFNFYSDYKLNANSYVFRTKIINQYNGFLDFLNNKTPLHQTQIHLNINKTIFYNSYLKKLTFSTNFNNFLLKMNGLKFFINLRNNGLKHFVKITRHTKFGTLITNLFSTRIGGTIYYDFKNFFPTLKKHLKYSLQSFKQHKNVQKLTYKTIIWLSEESYTIHCEPTFILVEEGDYISKDFELIPGLFSKTSGIVNLVIQNNIVKTISIKPGVVYQNKGFQLDKPKLYYPGETLLSSITVDKLILCEPVVITTDEAFLMRPITIYEISTLIKKKIQFNNQELFDFSFKTIYLYKPNQLIKSSNQLNLVSNILNLKINKDIQNSRNIELLNNNKNVNIKLYKKPSLIKFVSPNLQYTHIHTALLLQKGQFISNYSILGYLEKTISNSLEIIKFKIKKKTDNHVFLISNNDCFTFKKPKNTTYKLSDFILSLSNQLCIGKIIIENNDSFTVQKGLLYFFPNCKNDTIFLKSQLQYKTINPIKFLKPIQTNKQIAINYYNGLKLSVRWGAKQNNKNNTLKAEFTKLFIKKKGKTYSCLTPQFFKKLTINQKNSNLKIKNSIQSTKINIKKQNVLKRALLIKTHNSFSNKNKFNKSKIKNQQFVFINFFEQPFIKSTKSIGLYSITEDLFEQELNSIFCKNNEFIDSGKILGFLNIEKEITDDIVQGLPKIEEMFEARKKKSTLKNIPNSKKNMILIQKTSLDQNFEFRKLGTTIFETGKINTHKLLKVYFNYYGLTKYFLSDIQKTFKYNRLIKNNEGAYKSFKKIQIFILNSIQSIYKEQGVKIHDKHLEVIIKQMTTKVLITDGGNTPLLRREAIDLFHVEYINNTVFQEKKRIACYVPLLLGITKASLNNPSFISAASFQETTRILTKAAIEGQIDWLRGLKENIVIGHLIPSGTGFKNYKNSFKKPDKRTNISIHSLNLLT